MPTALPLPATVVRRLFRSKVRGTWRVATVLTSRLSSLHAVPIRFGDWPPVYLDMRDSVNVDWLTSGPHAHCPYEPAAQRTLMRHAAPGDVVVDVGANLGLHMMALAQRVGPRGRVHAVEPNPRLLPCLRRTVAELSNTTLHACAVGEREAELTLFVPSHDHGQASLADWTTTLPTRSAIASHRVDVRRLDDLVPEQPTLMKVDVEGAEAHVFRGARRILDRVDAPVLLFEELSLAEEAMGVPPHAAVDFLRSLEAPRYAFEIVADDGTLRPYAREHAGWINVLATPAARRV